MRGRSPLWVWVAVVIALAVVAGIILTRGDEVAADEIEVTNDVSVTGQALPEYTGAPEDAAVGMPAPAFSTRTTNDAPVSVDPGDGTARVIGFFAHWCPHCQAELPRVVDWREQHELPEGMELLMLSTAVDRSRPNYPPSAWFRREGWEGPVLVDGDDFPIAGAYGLTAFPFWVVVGPDGSVIERLAGELEGEAFDELIERTSALR